MNIPAAGQERLVPHQGFSDCSVMADGADGPADAEATTLPCGVAQAIADPIVRALMAADRIDPKSVAELMCRMAARLRNRPASAVGGLPW